MNTNHRSPLTLGLCLVVAWSGLLVHNIVETVDGSTIAIAMISLGLFLSWWWIPLRRNLAVRLLMMMGIIELIGAVVTVLPLGFLPFSPEQSLTHYILHVVYGASQLPLISATARMMKAKQ